MMPAAAIDAFQQSAAPRPKLTVANGEPSNNTAIEYDVNNKSSYQASGFAVASIATRSSRRS